MSRNRIPLERVLFGLAGTMTLLAVLLAAAVSGWFLALAAFVALNQLLYAWKGDCPTSQLLRRVRYFAREANR